MHYRFSVSYQALAVCQLTHFPGFHHKRAPGKFRFIHLEILKHTFHTFLSLSE